jgi:hypothetical protein
MTEISRSNDEDALRSRLGRKESWFGGMTGVVFCLVITLGMNWPAGRIASVVAAGWSRSAQAETTPPTVEFSQAMQCRLKTLVTQSPIVSPENGSKEPVRMQTPCDTRYAVIPSEAFSETPQKNALEQLLAHTPMKSFVESLMQYQSTTRALAVGIAKQESDWGHASPHKSGQDCYNYWGYKGVGKSGSVGGGYACFATPEEAVETVVGRIDVLVEKGLTTPQKMLVWKCGASCAAHSPESVSRWVNVVGGYYRQLNQG